jgi:tRNA dimethylallyltransferase
VVVAGGTGLYLRALLRGLFQAPPADESIRAEHRRFAEEQGLDLLYRELQAVDPEAARRIDQRDLIRISRALEVYQQTGRPLSEHHEAHAFARQRYPSLQIGITPPREELRLRIDRRVDAMMAGGWLEEVRRLVDAGYADSHPMGALGYKQLRDHLLLRLDLGEAVRQTKRDTWRFARRQLNWFRSDPDVQWRGEGTAVDVKQVARALREWRPAPSAG